MILSRLILKNFLYLITDRNISGLTHTRIARQAIAAGVGTLQLREKNLSKKEIYQEALSIRAVSLKYKTKFIVNDYIDIALAVDADGVHLGQEDMPVEYARKIMGRQKIIGVSTHSKMQAVRAQEAGADYIGFGPVFDTLTKDAGCPKGLKALKEIKRHIGLPIVAIGGITWENINETMNSGADACAVASGILLGNIKTNVQKYVNAVKLK